MKTIQVAEAVYAQTGQSTKTNEFGMREMQSMAYEKRNAQYLLLKAPPASGKSRALMFLALDKLENQGLKKVIVAVPEKSIGGSFGDTDLKTHGFFADWNPNDDYNLCTPGLDNAKGKVEAFNNFMENDEKILICTHATLRYACENIDDKKFDDVLVAIDEFHHVSADKENSRLGSVLHGIVTNSSAHIVAMTGSYFRGDGVAVLLPEDEEKFTKVTYNYYQQLNGYTHLKTLGIGYHFYQGKYISALPEVFDTDKKTILHIPNVNAGESTKDKYREVDMILDVIGDVDHQDHDTGVIYIKRDSDGKMLKIANLVDDSQDRSKIQEYLRKMNKDDIDIIIALGMAKEGFDWPYCEHALTVGYRSSLTEIIQIIGRCTRDSDNKTHAQFTNLIAQPDAQNDEVKISVNNMLKAITCSLLMEQVMAPHFNFKARTELNETTHKPGDILVGGLKEPSSDKVRDIIESDIHDLKASILQDDQLVRALPGNVDPEVINKIMIPKIIQMKYPDLSDLEVEEVRQHVVVDSVIKNGQIKEVGDKKFVRMAGQFVNIEDLNIDLIDTINPFQEAFEILSKSVTSNVLKVIQDTIDSSRIDMTIEEVHLLWPKANDFVKRTGRKPDLKSDDPLERRLAEAVLYLKKLKAEKNN